LRIKGIRRLVRDREGRPFESGLARQLQIRSSVIQEKLWMEARMRQVIIYLGEDGYWVAECPSLPGCVSQGKTKEEAITNIRQAIQGYIAALEEDHLPVPEEHFEALLVAV